jgi:hypothetical protein
MAMNTWNSAGAGRRGPSLGLGQVDILVPGTDDVGALDERMRHFGIGTRDDGRTVSFDDPWGNLIQVVDYREVQFTKTDDVLRAQGLDGLEKSDRALAELREKGIRT